MTAVPSWGILEGRGLPTVHLYADKMCYTIGRLTPEHASVSDIEVSCKQPLAEYMSAHHATVVWNGWGIPGYGHEEPRKITSNFKRSMGFSIEAQGRDCIEIKTGALPAPLSVPLKYGDWISLFEQERLEELALPSAHLRYWFKAPASLSIKPPPLQAALPMLAARIRPAIKHLGQATTKSKQQVRFQDSHRTQEDVIHKSRVAERDTHDSPHVHENGPRALQHAQKDGVRSSQRRSQHAKEDGSRVPQTPDDDSETETETDLEGDCKE